jgi:hypothetical protein
VVALQEGATNHVRWCGRGRGEPGPYPIKTKKANKAGKRNASMHGKGAQNSK